MITILKQQLQVFQLQAPPAPTDPAKPGAVLDVNEE
jgi:hypothetical protein